MAMWQSVPQSFSRSLFSSSTKYIRHVIKEQSLFIFLKIISGLQPLTFILNSHFIFVSLSFPFFPYPSPVPSPSGSNFSISQQTSCCGPHAPWRSKDTLPLHPSVLHSSPSRSSLLLSSDYLMQFCFSSIFTNVWIFLQENKTKILIKRVIFLQSSGCRDRGRSGFGERRSRGSKCSWVIDSRSIHFSLSCILTLSPVKDPHA